MIPYTKPYKKHQFEEVQTLLRKDRIEGLRLLPQELFFQKNGSAPQRVREKRDSCKKKPVCKTSIIPLALTTQIEKSSCVCLITRANESKIMYTDMFTYASAVPILHNGGKR